MNVNFLDTIIRDLNSGSLKKVYEFKNDINNLILELLNKSNINKTDIELIGKILNICNIVYNNTDKDLLPVEDGVYDLLLEKYKKYNPEDYQVGAEPIQFENSNDNLSSTKELINPFYYYTEEEINKRNNMLFSEIIEADKPLKRSDMIISPFRYDQTYISKRLRNTAHNYKELVGTLDKCKFVLESQAEEKGVLNDSNVKVLERDFFKPHLMSGIINYKDNITMILELKYDGISIEADVTDEIIAARTRGDTGEDVASDVTPILKGYKFKDAKKLDKPIGMKFEAIITYPNLMIYNKLRGTKYINPRTAVISIFGSSDGYLYRDLLTLVPLATSIKDENDNPLDRLVEIEFMNKYYCKEEYLRYSIINGNYESILFQIKKYVEEAEFARSYLQFMYDGVVLSYYDPVIRHTLGRVNSVNKYSVAIKFNALKKQTIFRGYKFTVGQDGSITPMIYYDPIEFMGAIHNKSTGSSYDRFKKLDLRIGDIIDVEYVNDVMPYVTKPMNSYNMSRYDNTEPYPFIEVCPSCGSKLELSKSGKTMYCMNLECKEKLIQRCSNMIQKLNLKDFGEESIRALKIYHFKDLMEADVERFSILGDGNKYKLKKQLDNIKYNPIEDYKIIGSLGFTGVALKKWKLIFNSISLKDLMDLYNSNNQDRLVSLLSNINGVGPITACTIARELEYFKDDIDYIINNIMIINTYQASFSPEVRFTGFRDKQLVDLLNSNGFDADDNAGVTKKTKLLIIPYKGYSSGNKYKKARKYNIPVMTKEEILESLQQD